MAKKILMSGNKVITTSSGAITFDVKDEQEKIVDLSMASGNQVISPDSEKVLSKITVNKPSTLIPDNIKKDVNIGGVVGTLESGTSSKIQPSKSLTITSNGTTSITPDSGYDGLSSVDVTVNVSGGGGGVGTCKLTINVTTPPSDDPEWNLEVCQANSSTAEFIILDANNQSAEIVLPNNGMFALVTYNTIDHVDTSDWGIFDGVGVSSDYVYNPDIVRTYICYAGETVMELGTSCFDKIPINICVCPA